jgi:hypothetical protein
VFSPGGIIVAPEVKPCQCTTRHKTDMAGERRWQVASRRRNPESALSGSLR